MGENPGQFFRVDPDRRLWIAKTDPYPDAPAIRVYFTFDDHIVWLLTIEPIGDDT